MILFDVDIFHEPMIGICWFGWEGVLGAVLAMLRALLPRCLHDIIPRWRCSALLFVLEMIVYNEYYYSCDWPAALLLLLLRLRLHLILLCGYDA